MYIYTNEILIHVDVNLRVALGLYLGRAPLTIRFSSVCALAHTTLGCPIAPALSNLRLASTARLCDLMSAWSDGPAGPVQGASDFLSLLPHSEFCRSLTPFPCQVAGCGLGRG